jgi:hypothetical protein
VHDASQTSGSAVVTVKVRRFEPRLQVKVPLLVSVPSGSGVWMSIAARGREPAAFVKTPKTAGV